MIKVLMIARATLYKIPGGDTVQILQTAKELANINISADIKLTNEKINYNDYDLLHFFNIIRPADILYHIKKSAKPYVVSPILVDYSAFDKYHRNGFSGILFKFFQNDANEYIKTLGRWILNKDKLMTSSYLWAGHKRSVKKILKSAAFLLPNSQSEYKRIVNRYQYNSKYSIVPNGVSSTSFPFANIPQKDNHLVLCVARIEGIKNQFNLIKALNDTVYNLVIIGSPAPNQMAYYNRCKQIAKSNITFIDHVPQSQLKNYYQKAKVHVLPSWFETTGLSSLEAAAMGCNVVITNKTDATEYFDMHAFYCDASSPESIYAAIEKASVQQSNHLLQEKVYSEFTWSHAAKQTKIAYQQIIERA